MFSTASLLALTMFEHLAHPPAGVTLIDIESRPSVAPLQIVGTLDPPTLVINGKAIKLPPDVDTSEVVANGPAGSFFIELKGEKAAIPILEIFGMKLVMNRTFLDLPFRKRLALEAGAPTARRHKITLDGFVPPGAKLEVAETVVAPLEGDRAQLTLELPDGESVITGRLHQAEGATRVFSIPVRAARVEHVSGEPILSIRPPADAAPYSPWQIPDHGITLEGLANPGASVELDDAVAQADSDGEFSMFVMPRGERWQSRLKITTAEGREAVFTKTMECSECAARRSWAAPRFRVRGERYLEGTILRAGEVSVSSGPTQSYFVPLLGIGYGGYVSQRLFVEARFERWTSLRQHESFPWGDRALELKWMYLLNFGLGWAVSRPLLVSIGPVLTYQDYTGSNFGEVYGNAKFGIGPLFALRGRFRLAERWEATPRLTMAQIMTRSFVKGIFTFEPCVVRYYF